jgi:DNA-binding CsgD family transcriptional regulator
MAVTASAPGSNRCSPTSEPVRVGSSYSEATPASARRHFWITCRDPRRGVASRGLLYGEWLRRERRRIDARRHLRAAHDQFTAIAAEGFGERARRELGATGDTARTRAPDAREELTAQETEIARHAALRQTNQEVGAQLFLSPRTVEWHLRKVFLKLGVSSRKELYDALPEEVRVSVPGWSRDRVSMVVITTTDTDPG